MTSGWDVSDLIDSEIKAIEEREKNTGANLWALTLGLAVLGWTALDQMSFTRERGFALVLLGCLTLCIQLMPLIGFLFVRSFGGPALRPFSPMSSPAVARRKWIMVLVVFSALALVSSTQEYAHSQVGWLALVYFLTPAGLACVLVGSSKETEFRGSARRIIRVSALVLSWAWYLVGCFVLFYIVLGVSDLPLEKITPLIRLSCIIAAIIFIFSILVGRQSEASRYNALRRLKYEKVFDNLNDNDFCRRAENLIVGFTATQVLNPLVSDVIIALDDGLKTLAEQKELISDLNKMRDARDPGTKPSQSEMALQARLLEKHRELQAKYRLVKRSTGLVELRLRMMAAFYGIPGVELGEVQTKVLLKLDEFSAELDEVKRLLG